MIAETPVTPRVSVLVHVNVQLPTNATLAASALVAIDVSAEVTGFQDDPPTTDMVAFNEEMRRRLAMKMLMRSVLKPLVTIMPMDKVKTDATLLCG